MVALADVDLAVRAAETGPSSLNGVGKESLINVISGAIARTVVVTIDSRLIDLVPMQKLGLSGGTTRSRTACSAD